MKCKRDLYYLLGKLLISFSDFFKFIPDEKYLSIVYRGYTGNILDLNNPKGFNEKLQWLKINDRDEKYTQLVDKFEVKNKVSKLLGFNHIIPTLGIWNSVDEIDFDLLPNQFVLKTTHDSGGIVLCRNKENFDINKTKKILRKSLRTNFYYKGREFPYKNVKPRIIAEKYMEDDAQNSLVDYKFYCFNGEPKFLYVSEGLENHATAKISFLNLDWTFAPYYRNDYKTFSKLPKKPRNFDQMIEFAKILSRGFKFVRVDLYEIKGVVYFSELTFTPASGWMAFQNIDQDLAMGKLLDLKKE
ncbi:glycosyltransferase [Streptococcus suis]|uniref:Glycosyltransferase n=1 Tax=Streptococcus suis TaxID=1307 RepID=A0A0Z8FC56_STRSU|nr:ATP-grasp fold amidoligase family protein [Streptococcus suis]NQH35074.1 glycosyl transferase [Streptococcus suis]CYU77573.1 glycosyltransferase [Streptococcus suis]